MTQNEEETVFPFWDIDDEELQTVETVTGGDSIHQLHLAYENLNLKTFDHMEYKMHDFDNEIDPENNFYNCISNTCQYYTDEQFKIAKTEGEFSVIHFNARSLYSKYSKIEKYLSQFSKFNIIAVSETWLNKDKGYNVGMEGYELFTLDRTYNKSGGVAIYVDQSLRCSMVPSMTTTMDGIMECSLLAKMSSWAF